MCKAFVPVLLLLYGVTQPWGYPLVSFGSLWYPLISGTSHSGTVASCLGYWPACTCSVVSDKVIKWQFAEFGVNCVCICINTFPPLASLRVVWVGSFDLPYIHGREIGQDQLQQPTAYGGTFWLAMRELWHRKTQSSGIKSTCPTSFNSSSWRGPEHGSWSKCWQAFFSLFEAGTEENDLVHTWLGTHIYVVFLMHFTLFLGSIACHVHWFLSWLPCWFTSLSNEIHA